MSAGIYLIGLCLLLHSLCSNMFGGFFWLKYTESLSSHRHVVGKWRSILITSSENCGDFSLILHQNSTCGHCNVESELFILYCIKTHWWFRSLNDLLPMQNVLTSHFGHLEDTSSLAYTDLSNADILPYIMFKKITCINIITDLIRKSLSREKLSRS